MKKFYSGRFLLFLLIFNLGLSLQQLNAQAAGYSFAASTGTFTELSDATSTRIAGVEADTYLSPATSIGFDFAYEGVTYTQFKMSSNGFISLNTTGTSSLTTNNFGTANASSRPIIAPLWDDLDGRAAGGVSRASYELTGTAPNRVLTVEWRNWEWNYNSGDAAISFQVKLYETTNKIEFIYRQEADAVNSGSASIGIGSATGSGSGSYLNVTSVASPAVSSTSAVTNLNTKPPTGQVYTWLPPACQMPYDVTAVPATTSATISWTAPTPAPASGYEYEVRTSGNAGSGATGLVASGATAAGVVSANITGLTAGTVYTIYVRANCGAGVFSSWTAAVEFATPPANDDCSNAISIAPTAYNATCTGYAASTAGATQSAGDPSCTSTSNNDDVWFKFTATSTDHIFKFSGMSAVTGSATALGMDLYSGSCGSLVPVTGACDATFGSAGAGERIVGGLTVGTEYLMRVWTASTSNSATFNLCVMQATAPTACVTSPSPANAATNIALNPELRWTAANLATSYDVYLGTANPPTTLLGNTTTNSIVASGLTANTVYYWYVVPKNAGGEKTGCTVYSFTTVVNPLPNDDCTGATTVTQDSYNSACTGTAFNTLNATKSGTPSSYFSSSHDDDLWYKFVASADKMVIRFTGITATAGTAGSMAYALYAGSDCGTFTDLGGNSVSLTSGAGESALWYGLTVGNTYFVRIATSGTTFRASGNLCILTPGVAAGTANTCASAGTVTISAANGNNNRWLPLIIGSSIIGEINAQGNDLGAVTSKVYVNTGALRQETGSGRYYLDRNFEITPATQPTTPVKVRLYILSAEVNAMIAQPASGVTSVNDLNITKTDAACSGTYSGTGTFIVPDARVGYNADAAYIEFSTSSFSSFYLHAGVGVLPVTLGDFTGHVKGAANRLAWTTLTETNNAGFELQRSNDGITFSGIAFIASKAEGGSSNTAIDYMFDDLKPLAGMNYYRLKQVDRDGRFSYSQVVQLSRKVESISITAIYPNPAHESLNLVITSPRAEKATLMVTDLAGRLVLQQAVQLQQGSNRWRMSTRALTAGNYVVKLACAAGCEAIVERFNKN